MEALIQSEREKAEKSKEKLIEREQLIQRRMEEKKERLREESLRKRQEAEMRVQKALERNEDIMRFFFLLLSSFILRFPFFFSSFIKRKA